jgi:parallel beta-helix repeat protein
MPRVTFALALALLLAGCRDEHPLAPSTPLSSTADRSGARAIVVEPGGSIQAAVAQAGAGGTVRIKPGLYREGITISQPGLTIVGVEGAGPDRVVIENPGGVRNGVQVQPGANGFSLSNVTIRGFEANGVFLNGIDGFTLSRVVAEHNGTYGLFPVRSSNGLIERSVATGHSDAGLYIGQSANVTMERNRVFGNVVGIEASNSSGVRILRNEAWDNTNGILAVLLPGRQVKVARDLLIARNTVRDNNRANFARPGDLVGAVPAGTGILIVGADQVTAQDNLVTGNRFIGIGVGSSLVLAALAGAPPDAFADIEPNPEQVRVSRNVATANGQASPIGFLPPADLLWDGSGTGNCWERNQFESSAPARLPGCPAP